MLISRGNFTKIAAGSALVLASGLRVQDAMAALPTTVTDDQLDDAASAGLTFDLTNKKGQVKHPIHTKPPTTNPFLTDGYRNIFGSKYDDKSANKPWGGSTHVIIDEEGNWLFGGVFPSHGLGYTPVCNIATGIALSSDALGQAFAWTAQGQLNKYITGASPTSVQYTPQDWSFQRQGNSKLIANLWKYAVKGHKFVGSTSYQLIHDPNATPEPPSSSGGGGSSILSDVGTALGVIGTIFAFL